MDNLVTQMGLHHLCPVPKVDGGTMNDEQRHTNQCLREDNAKLIKRVEKLEAALREITEYDEYYGGVMIRIACNALEGAK